MKAIWARELNIEDYSRPNILEVWHGKIAAAVKLGDDDDEVPLLARTLGIIINADEIQWNYLGRGFSH